ncbi:hypothetical protein AB4305_08770 [Nocardia sp. 2YAB30]
MNSLLFQVFSLVLLLGSLAAVIPMARQVLRRSERDDSDDH